MSANCKEVNITISKYRESLIRLGASDLYTAPPDAPQNLSVLGVDDGQVSLDWDDVATADSYTVYVYNNVSDTLEQTITGVSVSNHTPTGLTNNQEYEFWVTAVKGGVESPESNHVIATPAPAPVFEDDFSAYVDAATPATFSQYKGASTFEVFSDAALIGGKGAAVSKASGNGDLDGYYVTDHQLADCEILVKVAATQLVSSSTTIGLFFRGVLSGSSHDGWYVDLGNGSSDLRIRFFKVTNGSWSLWTAPSHGVSWGLGDYMWLRVRLEGTTISARAWKDGTSEPGAWQGSFNDSHNQADGYIGFGMRWADVAQNVDIIRIFNV